MRRALTDICLTFNDESAQLESLLQGMQQRKFIWHSVDITTGRARLVEVDPEGLSRIENDWLHSSFTCRCHPYGWKTRVFAIA